MLTAAECRRQLAAMPLFAGVPAAELDKLNPAYEYIELRKRPMLFTHDAVARDVYFIHEGAVCITAGVPQTALAGGQFGAVLHVRGPSDFVAGVEIVPVVSDVAMSCPRGVQALLLTPTVQVLRVQISELTRLARGSATFRSELTRHIVADLTRVQQCAEEALTTRGKARLARLLLEIFDRCGGAARLPVEINGRFTQTALAQMLGLVTRSVQEGMRDLEIFGAVDQGRGQGQVVRLVLHDRERLQRIARLDAPDTATEEEWLGCVKAAMADGDTVLALELAREGVKNFRTSLPLRHAAVLAAMRSGADRLADELIDDYGFSQQLDPRKRADAAPSLVEDIAALTPRLLKERAFLASDAAEARRLALASAEGYLRVYQCDPASRIYTGINAASMFLVAGKPGLSRQTAQELLPHLAAGRADYWTEATRAEAHCLLDEMEQAGQAIGRAIRSGGGTAGNVASTIRQLRRLQAATAIDTDPLMQALRPRPVLFIAPPLAFYAGAPPQAAAPVEPDVEEASVIVMCCATERDAEVARALAQRHPDRRLLVVMHAAWDDMVKAANMADPAKRRLREHLAAANLLVAGPAIATLLPAQSAAVMAARHGLGLAVREAWLREADCYLLSSPLLPAPLLPAIGERVAVLSRGVRSCLPDAWAAPDALPGDVRAVIGVDTDDARPALDLIRSRLAGIAVQAGMRACADQDISLWSGGSIAAAIAVALDMAAVVAEGAPKAFVTCDLDAWNEARDAPRGALRLAELRPAGPPGGVVASEAFATECILFPAPLAHVTRIGRLSSITGRRGLVAYGLTAFRQGVLERGPDEPRADVG